MERREFINKSIVALASAGAYTHLLGCDSNKIGPLDSPLGLDNTKPLGRTTLASFPPPIIMNWTVLPVTFMAACWIDEAFRSAFINDPTTFFADRPSLLNIPENSTFTVHANTSTSRHLALPHYSSVLQQMPRSQVAELLVQETGNDNSLEWLLPPTVIEEAFYNQSFRSSLIANPASALASMVFSTNGLTFYVHPNEVHHFNIPLPTAPQGVNSSTSFATALVAAKSMIDLASSKCCATGTCDDDDESPIQMA
jgi:hypothetical protein